MTVYSSSNLDVLKEILVLNGMFVSGGATVFI